jgi:carboxymethylenebutenolidase
LNVGSNVDLASGLPGYLALPAGAGPHPGVLLFMEAFGLNGYVRSECDRLARLGYAALAPDFYRGDVFSYANFTPVAQKIQSIGDAGFVADIRAALAFLDARADVRHDGYGVVGFCMGGRLAFLTAAELGSKVRAASIFYGGGIAPEVATRRPALGHRVPDVTGRLLFNYGADDTSILPAEHARLAEALSAAKHRYTIDVYDGAPHAFANCVRESYRPEAAAAAWAATLRLFGETLS